MRKLFTMMLMIMALSLGACASDASSSQEAAPSRIAIDPFELSIRVGRMDVMMGHGDMALGMIADKRGVSLSSDPGDDISERKALYAQLRQTVLRHNRLWVQACEFDISIQVCQNMFEPGWMGLPFSHAPTWQQLDLWTLEVQEQVGSLAGVLCSLAEQGSGRKQLCPIE